MGTRRSPVTGMEFAAYFAGYTNRMLNNQQAYRLGSFSLMILMNMD